MGVYIVKKILTLAVALVGVVGVSLASAADTLRIGVVNLGDVIEKSSRMKVVSEDLKKQFEPQRKDILAREKHLSELKAQFAKENSKMTEAKKTEMRKNIYAEQAKLQSAEQDFMTSVQDKRTAALKHAITEINGIVAGIAERDHFDIVLQSGSAPYVAKNLDITTQVLSQFDNKSAQRARG
jgi:outer membrane protein